MVSAKRAVTLVVWTLAVTSTTASRLTHVRLGTARGLRSRVLLSSDGEGPKGFDPKAEERVRRKLESLRSDDQVQRMQSEADRERMEQMIRDEGLNVVPEVVNDRMIKRMVGFLSVPIALGVLAFVGFVVAAKFYDTTIRPTTVAITTQAIFAFGVIGITYGPLSASWDEDREGSLLGFDEARKNVASLLESIKGPPPSL